MAEDTVTTPSADADNTEPATAAPDTAAPDTAAGSDSGARKVREGLVVSNKMEKPPWSPSSSGSVTPSTASS